MADRRTAAELRSFTMRRFLMSRAPGWPPTSAPPELRAARQQAVTQVLASAAGGVAMAGVYIALGLLLAAEGGALAVAGTAMLAIRSAQSSLSTLLYSVNQC
jgi:ATP-binding cassette subfamily B protein/ATP-binding cassette subfamily C protein